MDTLHGNKRRPSPHRRRNFGGQLRPRAFLPTLRAQQGSGVTIFRQSDDPSMPLFAPIDLAALACFVGGWAAYALAVERLPYGRSGLSAHMDRYREIWMRRMLHREARMVDMQIMAALQNGTAFFASTSLIAIGGALTLLRSTDEMLAVFGTLPFGITTTRAEWEAKSLGLAIIFVYAFFKFAWSYRLFNYLSILLGAAPPIEEKDTPEALA